MPSIAIEISPVSSETIMQAESEISLAPIAALCLVPYLQLSLGSFVSGKRTPAATILSLCTTNAPSCNGVFGKKIVNIRV